MKSYVCIIAIFMSLAITNCEVLPEFMKVFDECAEEVGLNKETYKGPQDRNDPKGKCHHACMMKKFGSLVDGKIDIEKAIDVAEKLGHSEPVPDPIKAIMTECASKANEEKEDCEVAGTFKKCMSEKRPRQ